MKKTIQIAIIVLLASVARADGQHAYPTNPAPDKAAFFGQLGRDTLVVTNPAAATPGGGVDTNQVRDIVRPMVSASTNNLRRVDEMAVYDVTRTENTDWTWDSDDKALEAAIKDNGVMPRFEDYIPAWRSMPVNFSDYQCVALDFSLMDATEVTIGFKRGNLTSYATASRPRYMDETLVPSTNAVMATIATNGTGAVSTGDLMKLDADGRLVKATAGTDYLQPRYDFGDIGVTSLRWEAGYLGLHGPIGLYIMDGGGLTADEYDSSGWYLRSHTLFAKADRATTLSGYGITDAATKTEVNEAKETANEAKVSANEANVWSSATFNFMTGGRTNCWFSGTNYVFGTDAAARTRFSWEDGMDAATVPCSMALWEIRDGERQLVWDQRDWTAWYWSFKANQMQANVTAQIAALGLAVTNDSNYAWAKRYASDGTPNPDASTTFIDTPSVTLSPGMKWETVATVSGAAYWTIVGDGAIIGGSGTNAVLRIQDFEGNDIMTVTKGEHRLAWIERGEITGQMYDGDGRVCFDMLADAEPVGYFSTTLDSSDFLPQTDPNCPAQYEWEDLHNGKYRIHYLLKPGIQSNACFAKFQVEVEGQTIIRYNAGQEISGGLIYNGVKIAPDISGSPAVGTVIQWKVVR